MAGIQYASSPDAATAIAARPTRSLNRLGSGPFWRLTPLDLHRDAYLQAPRTRGRKRPEPAGPLKQLSPAVDLQTAPRHTKKLTPCVNRFTCLLQGARV